MVVTDSHLDHFLKGWLDQNVYRILPVKQDLMLACVFTLQCISMGQTLIYGVNIQDQTLMGCQLIRKIIIKSENVFVSGLYMFWYTNMRRRKYIR